MCVEVLFLNFALIAETITCLCTDNAGFLSNWVHNADEILDPVRPFILLSAKKPTYLPKAMLFMSDSADVS